MKQYLELLKEVYENGEIKEDRTGVGTKSITGAMLKFDLREGFPLLTTKKIDYKKVLAELLWFLSGSTSIDDLKAIYPKCNIWDPWAKEDNTIGKMYGYQWTKFNDTLNQVDRVIEELKVNPYSRRLLVTAYNPLQANDGVLYPCHYNWQLVSNGEYLDLIWVQRSIERF